MMLDYNNWYSHGHYRGRQWQQSHYPQPQQQQNPSQNIRSQFSTYVPKGGPLIVELDEISSDRSSPLRSGRSAAYRGGTSRKLKQRREAAGHAYTSRNKLTSGESASASSSHPQPPSARPWHQVNKDVSARMMAATSDSPPLIPKRDYNNQTQSSARVSTTGSNSQLKEPSFVAPNQPPSECISLNNQSFRGPELETQQQQIVLYEGMPEHPMMHPHHQYGDFGASTFAPGVGGPMMGDPGNMMMPLAPMHLQQYMMPPPPNMAPPPMPFMGGMHMMEQPPFMPHHMPPPYSMPPPMMDQHHMAMMALPPKHQAGMLPSKHHHHHHQQKESSAENTCYMLCCKGHTQVLWIVVGIILAGVILGVVLGLTLIDDDTYSQ